MSCMQRALPCRGAAALRVPAAHALYAPDRRAAALKRDRPAAACHAWTTGDRCYAVDAKSPRRLLAAATWSIPADSEYSCGFLAAASHAILSRHAAISYLRALQLLLISSVTCVDHRNVVTHPLLLAALRPNCVNFANDV